MTTRHMFAPRDWVTRGGQKQRVTAAQESTGPITIEAAIDGSWRDIHRQTGDGQRRDMQAVRRRDVECAIGQRANVAVPHRLALLPTCAGQRALVGVGYLAQAG